LKLNNEISVSAKGGHMEDLTDDQVIQKIRTHYRTEKKNKRETLKSLAPKIGVDYVTLHYTVAHKIASRNAIEKYRLFIRQLTTGESEQF
jgi:hypothetical protein